MNSSLQYILYYAHEQGDKVYTMTAKVNELAPELQVASWVQGSPVTLVGLRGQVVLVEVFQVNCPGCFIQALPEAVRLHDLYEDQGLVVIGVATAFEDYEQNTLENLQQLLDSGKLTAEPFKALQQRGELVEGRLRWKIPFAVAMDEIVKDEEPVTEQKILKYAQRLYPDMQQRRAEEQGYILKMMQRHLEQKTMTARTFESYDLKGTPSSILIDREGILREVAFGPQEDLESMIRTYLG